MKKAVKKQNQSSQKPPRILVFLLICLGLEIITIFTLLFFQSKINTQFLFRDTTEVVAISAPVATVAPQATPTPPSAPTYPQGNSVLLPILMYHYIGNNPNLADLARNSLSVTPDKFEEQMKYLAQNGYTTLSLDTFYAILKKQASLPTKPVILTFDDGYVDFYYNAYPILRQYNLNATVFIITGFVGRGAYLNWSQIREMQSSGVIHFGAHTVNHYQLTALSDASLRYELSESKKVLEGEIGVPVNFMAYPYGISNSRVIQFTREAGYVGSTGTWPGNIQSEGTVYNMPRYRIGGSYDLATFIKFL